MNPYFGATAGPSMERRGCHLDPGRQIIAPGSIQIAEASLSRRRGPPNKAQRVNPRLVSRVMQRRGGWAVPGRTR